MSLPEEGTLPPFTLAVVGPTASGKSAFALEAAERFGGEILSCDSMAVYRGLDIGTDKPSALDRERVRHHLIDVADPGSTFSAGAFRRAALRCMADMAERGMGCVLVGGTGFITGP
jgi:tRNA dimethylallyltransferase